MTQRQTPIGNLFRQHHSEMLHLAQTLLYDKEEAEDAVQDVFVRLMYIDVLPSDDKMKAYLMTAVRNICINRIKQKSIREQVRNLFNLEAVDDICLANERQGMLDDIYEYASCSLSEPHRTIFRLRFEEGMKLKEIAGQLNINLKTVFKYMCQSIGEVKRQFMQT